MKTVEINCFWGLFIISVYFQERQELGQNTGKFINFLSCIRHEDEVFASWKQNQGRLTFRYLYIDTSIYMRLQEQKWIGLILCSVRCHT